MSPGVSPGAAFRLIERLRRFVPFIVLAAGALLLGAQLRHGWFPHDEGSIAQSAERVLGGEIPHRDFDEIYTGLLSYLHAGVFAVLGKSLVALRSLLMFGALAWLWALYRALTRFTAPEFAGLAAITAFVWSVPNYPASLPSWYILFTATFGALALLKWRETAASQWLVVAGAMGGVAFLFKLTGIFFFMGGGLALLALREPANELPVTPADRAANATVTLALVLVLGALIRVTGNSDRELLRFTVPTGALVLAISLRALTRAAEAPRWRTLVSRVVPFAVGGAIPVLLFVLLYAFAGGFGAMVDGVFITPFRRIASASFSPPPITHLLFVVPIALVLWLPSANARVRRLAPYLAAALAAWVVMRSAPDLRFYRVGWISAWGLLFIAAIDAAEMTVHSRGDEHGLRRDGAVILGCVAVAMALIEYPFAAPIYTVYALPLAMAAVVALVRARGRVAVGVQAAALGFFLLFGLMRVLPGTVGTLGVGFSHSGENTLLTMPRGGLYVDRIEASTYIDLVQFVQETAHGRALWAGPDAPEVYFLTGLPNHTRTFFDFLDTPAQMQRPIVERIASTGADVVVVKLRTQFSRLITAAQVDSLKSVYPQQRGFPGFIVLWR